MRLSRVARTGGRVADPRSTGGGNDHHARRISIFDIGPLLDSYQHDVEAIMRASLESEAKALALYRELLKCAEGHSVVIEEYARQMVYAEELHASEVDKMRRKPDKVAAFRPSNIFLGTASGQQIPSLIFRHARCIP
jgi:hypothetical protein